MQKILLLGVFVALSNTLGAQCLVTNIVFGEPSECREITNQFIIPVTVYYVGTPNKIKTQTTGINYELIPQYYNHTPAQSFTFVLYGNSDGANQSISVTATLEGGNCSNQTFNRTYGFVAPEACDGSIISCQDAIILTGTVDNQTFQSHLAKLTVTSSQAITNTEMELKANQTVILTAGFSYKPTATKSLIINNEGCIE